MKILRFSLVISLLLVSLRVNAGICRKIEGYVTEFDDKTITFKVLFKKKMLKIDQAALGPEQLQFMKKNINTLIDECVPYESVIRQPAQVKKK